MHRGYIKLWRVSKDHPFYNEHRPSTRREAWEDILLSANHAKKEFIIGSNILECNPGECLKSLETWAREWHWSKSKVRRFLHLLQNMNQICLKSETVTVRISVLKWETYQGDRNGNETQVKRKRNASETQVAPNKNVKNVKNDKNDIIYTVDFLEFWKEYPKKVGKISAFDQWKKYKPPLQEVLNALKWQKESRQWNEGYILDPERYIKKGKWQDEQQTEDDRYAFLNSEENNG